MSSHCSRKVNPPKSKKLIIFDIESVLLDAEFLPNLAKLVGKGEEAHSITMKGIRGEIKWEDGLMQRIELVRGVGHKEAMKVADSMPYMSGAKEACEELKRKGYILVGVTGGFLFADRVKKELGFDYMITNELQFNNGVLAGVKHLRVRPSNVQGLEEVLESVGARKEHTTAVLDGANNMKLFEYADIKVAFNAQPVVKKYADVVIDKKDVKELLKHL